MSGKKIRVFIADDHALVREGIRHFLDQQPDLEVVGEAENGEEAVTGVVAQRPDVALIDIAMPKVNGIEATQRIKNSCPGTAVLVLTAYDDEEYILALLDAGAAGYLLKSVRSNDLAVAVRAVRAGESVLHPEIVRKLLARPATRREGGEMAAKVLTEREMEVLRLAAAGMGNKEIADALVLSVRTVQGHLAEVFAKLNVASRTEAVVYALRKGWLRLEGLR